MAGKAWIIVDLGFGDQGKGATTDALVQRTQSELVVRFNGGAQAAHHVNHSPGLEHTFHQFGSGTFSGAHTFLSKFVIFNPIALVYEARDLLNLGVKDPYSRISVDPECLVSTPFHSVINRMRASLDNTGTCGMGIGETISHSLAKPDQALRYQHLFDEGGLKDRLIEIREWAREQYQVLNGPLAAQMVPLVTIKQARQVLFEDAELDAALKIFREVAQIVGQSNPYLLKSALRSGDVVFEGAQGILLDEDYGFHPHTTWSKCTTHNARTLLADAGHTDICSLGIVRSYQTRHGHGPFPTEYSNPVLLDTTNPTNEWQGAFRVGTLDCVLTEYALNVSGGVNYLVLNHLDMLDRLPESERVAVTQHKDKFGFRYSCLHSQPKADLALRTEFTQFLKTLSPSFSVPLTPSSLEDVLGKPIFIEGRGPGTGDRKFNETI